MFSIEPAKITRELLVHRNPEERYMSHYLGVNPKPGLICSPLREDKNPTCAFYRDPKGRLIFKDFGVGFHGDFIEVVRDMFRTDYHTAMYIIANDFGIKKRPTLAINLPKIKYDNSVIEEGTTTNIQCQIRNWTDFDLNWWNTFGITESTLKKYKVFPVETVFINGEIKNFYTQANPIYGYYFGKLDGVEQWKIYFPKRTSVRFLLNSSLLQGAKQLPKTGELLVITKSLKDVMSLYELGVNAVAPQAESTTISKRQISALQNRFTYNVTNGDWDRAGQRFMFNSRRLYPTYCLAFKDKGYYGKDISDFIAKHGKENAKELIQQLKYDISRGKYDNHLKYSKGLYTFVE